MQHLQEDNLKNVYELSLINAEQCYVPEWGLVLKSCQFSHKYVVCKLKSVPLKRPSKVFK